MYCVCTVLAEARRGAGFPGTGVADSLILALNVGSLEEQPVLLTTETHIGPAWHNLRLCCPETSVQGSPGGGGERGWNLKGREKRHLLP